MLHLRGVAVTARVYRADDWHPVSRDAADVIAIGAERVIDDGRRSYEVDPAMVRDLARTVVALRDGAPDCDTTHHTGCACHEARRDARERELAEALQALCDCVSMPDVDEVRVECDVCRGGMEGHDATCPVGHALRVLDGGAT